MAAATHEGSDMPRDSFEWAVVFLALSSAVVLVEPAPFDVLFVLMLPVAVLLRRVALPRGSLFGLACVGLWLLANLLSLPMARDLEVSTRYGAISLYLVVAWALTIGLAGKLGERTIGLFMLGWAWGAVLTVTPAIASYFGILPFAEFLVPSGRMNALFKDPNVLGAWLVVPALWSVSRLVSLERGLRLRWMVVLAISGVGILLSYSRGAWISVGIALFVFVVLRLVGRGTARARVMTLLLLPFAAAMVGIAFDRITDLVVIQDMLEVRLGPQQYDADRFATQRAALQLALEQPLGIGPGQSERTFARAAHSSYVRGLVENGYLGGLSLTLLMFGSMLRAAWRAIDVGHPRYQAAMAVVAGSLAAIFVESFVIDSIHWRHMWILLGLAWTPKPSQ